MKEIRQNNLKMLADGFKNQRAFADAIESTPGYVSQLIIGTCSFGEKVARKIEKLLNLPDNYMDVIHDQKLEDLKLNKIFFDNNLTVGPDNKGDVPVISWVQAGAWCEAVDNFNVGDAERWIPCPVAHSKHTYALKVRGDSMVAPYGSSISFPEGTLIYVDPEVPLVSGKKVIAKLLDSNEVTFKVYREESGKKWLVPLNPQYDKIELVEGMHVCGVVIFMGSDV
ncbi:MAG: S24 family peptidase [Methylococcales bacterium]|nr:S24 family peptidase [Methylococcales bacterium]